jgi:dihydropyrimidinase
VPFCHEHLLVKNSCAYLRCVGIVSQGGTVVNADRQFPADVLIQDGKIKQVAPSIIAPLGTEVLDATGKLVCPGGIDPHTHLDMPFMGQVTCDDFFSGQAAALAGGTTFHIDFALPVEHDLLKGYHTWQNKAANAVMDYSFHMAVTSWSDKVAAQMGELAKTHGINSFKFFMSYKGALMVTDTELLAGLAHCRQLGALAQVHAENGDAVAEGQKQIYDAGIRGPEGHALSRPAELETEATHRAVRLAEFVGTPLYVVHIMNGDAANEIAKARARGARVVGETVTSAISLEESLMWHRNYTIAAQYVMSPPIRSANHRERVRAALAGGALQVLGTDHAVFNSSQKAMGRNDFRILPNGVNGIEERLHVAWQELVVAGRMSPTDFVRAVSTAAAQIFNIYPQKGIVASGSDADVIIFDPNVEHMISAATHHSRMDTNVYEGKIIRGKVVTTISAGRVVWHDGKLRLPARGTGRYIPLPTGGPMFEGLDARKELAMGRYGSVPVARDLPNELHEINLKHRPEMRDEL